MNEHDNDYYRSAPPTDASAHYGASYNGSYGTVSQQTPGKHKSPRRGMSPVAVIALCLLCSLLAAALGVGGTYLVLENGLFGLGPAVISVPHLTTQRQPIQPADTVDATGDETDEYQIPLAAGSAVYELAKQQVVGVTTAISYTNIFGQVSASSVTGSGFIISPDGYIMTNNHVIEDAVVGGYEVSVLLNDGAEYTAKIIGHDEENDIAVLKIDANGLNAATLGDSDMLTVGQEVYAVGNPLGELNYTMTTGIISATDRAITTDTDSVPINMFQIDAAVNSGNSGGPVYNTAGQIIGVVTAKTSATGVEGLGFAIPINDAAHIANQLLEHGYVTDRAAMGVGTRTLPASVAQRYGMVEGAYVTAVTPGGPGEKAGIREGDIITAIDGQPVAGSTELTGIQRTYAVGDTVQVEVWRAGETVQLEVTFGESPRPADPTPAPQQQFSYGYGYGDMDDFFRRFFGGFGF